MTDTTVRDFFQLAAVFAVDPDTGEQAPFAWGLGGIYTAVEVRALAPAENRLAQRCCWLGDAA